MNRIRKTTVLAACLLAATGIATRAHADTITLKTAARQPAGAVAVLLGDIATLQGEEAQRLAQTPIAKFGASGKPLQIEVADVRRALEAAGANWARIDLSGGTVIVRPTRGAANLPPAAMTAIALPGASAIAPRDADRESPMFALDAVQGEASVRGMIADLIIATLQVQPCDMRLKLETEDAALLAASTATVRFEVQPLGSLAGDRLAFAVRCWQGATPEDRGQITLTAQRRMTVLHAARDLQRQGPVAASDFESREQWLAATEASAAATPAETLGRTLTRAVNKGDLLRRRDLSQQALVKRGDLVTVRCLVGGVALSLQAEARSDGSAGDAIEFRKSGERETFRAIITGAGVATIDLSRS